MITQAHPAEISPATPDNGWQPSGVEKVNKSALCSQTTPNVINTQTKGCNAMESKKTTKAASAAPEKDKSKVHKLSLKGSAKLVAEFVSLRKKRAAIVGVVD